MIKQLELALSKILLYFPCFGYFIYGWEIIENKDISTMGTSYDKLIYNPDFCQRLDVDQLAAVVIHECVHNMFLHPTAVTEKQAQGKVKELWEIALEMVTNAEVIKILKMSNCGFKLPGRPYSPFSDAIPEKGEEIYYYDSYCENLTAIEIYEKLVEKFKDKIVTVEIVGSGGGKSDNESKSKSGKEDEVKNETKDKVKLPSILDKIIPSDEKEKMQEAIEKTIAVIEKMKKQIGDAPAGIERFIKRLQKTSVPWIRILLAFLSNIVSGAEEYRWERPNHRHPLADQIVMPGLIEVEQDDIVFVVDTSGSMSDNQLSQIAAELGKVAQIIPEVVVITTDAEIQERIKAHGLVDLFKKLKFKGGGGTDFCPVFEKIKKCQCMIFFTDGFATYPKKPPQYPVLWVLTKENSQPPFGKVCYVLDV